MTITHPTTMRDLTVAAAPPDGACRVNAVRFSNGEASFRREAIAEEVPVALIYNGQPFVVMMASPLDLEDFARGFSLTEGIVDAPGDIESIEVATVARGIEIRLTIRVGYANALSVRRRNLAGRSGCGLCGADSFASALRPIAKVSAPLTVAPAAIRRAAAELPQRQFLNQALGAIHAAAFASPDGTLLLVREDIGRHNALDKLIGALADSGIDPASGFVVVTSRCSYEMVHKTASAGIALIAAVSAPTNLAVELAARHNVTLAGFAREGRFTVYAGPNRVGRARAAT
jgi:FdhD protein